MAQGEISVSVLQKISDEFVRMLLDKGIAQADIVMKSGRSKGYISKIVSGVRHFSLDDISMLSQEYCVPVISLISKHLYGGRVSDSQQELLTALTSAEESLARDIELLKKMEEGKKVS